MDTPESWHTVCLIFGRELSYLMLDVVHHPFSREYQGLKHRHYIHRLSLSGQAAGKICTVVNLGLATAESVWLNCVSFW